MYIILRPGKAQESSQKRGQKGLQELEVVDEFHRRSSQPKSRHGCGGPHGVPPLAEPLLAIGGFWGKRESVPVILLSL